MTAAPPDRDRQPRVVIVGGGFGGLEAAKALARQPVAVTVCDRRNYHLFQPLLYQVALAGLAATDISVPIRSVLRRDPNIEVLLADVTGVDLEARVVRYRGALGDDQLAYDYLVIAAGAGTNYYGHGDWAAHAPALKDLEDALAIRARVLLAFEAAERAADAAARRRLLTFVVIGGGPTGVELAGAIADLSRDILRRDFRHISATDTRVVLVEMGERILSAFHPRLSASAATQLRELGVDVRTGARVQSIDEGGVLLGGDERIASATVLWGAGVQPSPLAAALPLPRDRAGRIVVGDDCAVPGHPEVFAIGDIACFIPAGTDRPLPGVSPVAMQQGRSVAANILRTVRAVARRPFVYRDKGIVATIGRSRAVVQIGRLRLSGLVAWIGWALLHLWYLVGFRNRVFVFMGWIWSYVVVKHGARVITSSSVGGGGPAPPPPPP